MNSFLPVPTKDIRLQRIVIIPVSRDSTTLAGWLPHGVAAIMRSELGDTLGIEIVRSEPTQFSTIITGCRRQAATRIMRILLVDWVVFVLSYPEIGCTPIGYECFGIDAKMTALEPGTALYTDAQSLAMQFVEQRAQREWSMDRGLGVLNR